MSSPVARPTFALIGVAGYIARRHLEAIREVGGTLIACHDITDSVGILDSYFPDARFFTDGEQFEGFLSEPGSRPDVNLTARGARLILAERSRARTP